MQLPISGRIVLVDDKRDDVWPLIEVLGRNGIPYLYFDGTPDKLPESPLEGVRFVFLDILLQGMQGQDDKTKASALAGRLKAIVSDRNGPYVIIFWTRHSEVITEVMRYCSRAGIPPVTHLDLEKNECMNGDGTYDMQALSLRLKDKLSGIGAFELYTAWENLVNMATKRFVYDFSTLVPSDEGWEKWSSLTSAIFARLYKTYVDQNELQDATEQFQCAALLINRSFHDTLQNTVATELRLPSDFDLTDGRLDMTTMAKINKSLFLSDCLMSRVTPGYVYPDQNSALVETLKKAVFKVEEAPSESTLCKVVVTPECDLAQQKTLMCTVSETEHRVHRVIYGLLFPSGGGLAELKKKKFVARGQDARFTVGPIWHGDRCQLLLLHLSTMSFQNEEEIQSDPIFALRRDLLFDLQSKAANHVNRLGNFQIQ